MTGTLISDYGNMKLARDIEMFEKSEKSFDIENLRNTVVFRDGNYLMRTGC